MCGICGVAWSDAARPVESDVLDRMTHMLAHRGPNDSGIHTEPGVGLGMRRLAIIDPGGGGQPMVSEDGSVMLICNGEIYDFVEHRERLRARGHRFRTASDVEVMIHLYEDHGLDFVDHLRGMFAFALWDGRRRRLILGRDRVGIKPLQYALLYDGLVFASEAKSILASGLVPGQRDARALADLFTWGFVRGPRTFLEGIRHLPPGELLIYQDGRATTRRYWRLDFPEAGTWPGASRDEWSRALAHEMEEAVRLHLRADVPLGAWLSGGLDSSAVTALMAQETDAPVDAYSVGFEEAEYDELRDNLTLDDVLQERIRPHRVQCGVEHLSILPRALWHMEEPTDHGVDIPRLLVSDLAARDVRAVLSGEGADEVLGGYHWYGVDRLLREAPTLVEKARAGGPMGPAKGWWRWVEPMLRAPVEMGPERYAAMVGVRNPQESRDLLARGVDPPPEQDGALPPGVQADRFGSWHPFNQLQAWDLGVRLPDLVLKTVDRLSMAVGLEVRVPFLDPMILDLCSRMPPRVKGSGSVEKRVLRDAVADLLPREIAQRRKRPFQAPHEEWMRGPLPDGLAHLLKPAEVKERGHFRPDAVASLLRRHRQGEADLGSLLWCVLQVQLWDEVFLRRRGPGQALPPPSH